MSRRRKLLMRAVRRHGRQKRKPAWVIIAVNSWAGNWGEFELSGSELRRQMFFEEMREERALMASRIMQSIDGVDWSKVKLEFHGFDPGEAVHADTFVGYERTDAGKETT